MKKIWILLIAGLLTAIFSGVSIASTYTFETKPSPYGDGNVWNYRQHYIWGLDSIIQDNETIVGASLFFDDIKKIDHRDAGSYIHLLSTHKEGLFAYNDTIRRDQFRGQGVQLTKWKGTPKGVSYTFDIEEVEALNAYVSQGIFGLGFDPDCSFFMNGIKFNITTEDAGGSSGNPEAVPEPATMLLLGAGVLCLAPFRKRFGKS